MSEAKALEAEAQNFRKLYCIRLDQPDLCTPGPVQIIFKTYPVLTELKEMGMPTVAGLLAYGELYELDPEDLCELDQKTVLAMLQHETLRLKKRLRAELSRI